MERADIPYSKAYVQYDEAERPHQPQRGGEDRRHQEEKPIGFPPECAEGEEPVDARPHGLQPHQKIAQWHPKVVEAECQRECVPFASPRVPCLVNRREPIEKRYLHDDRDGRSGEDVVLTLWCACCGGLQTLPKEGLDIRPQRSSTPKRTLFVVQRVAAREQGGIASLASLPFLLR